MFKKVLSLVLALALCVGACVGLASCGNDDFKVGFICLHDENSTYDNNFIQAAYAAQQALGLKDSQVIIKKNIPETTACYDAAVELVEDGCKVIFADSFGHEEFMIQAAEQYPDVQFCHATGTSAKSKNLSNFHNAFASIYEGRYLAGVAAGLKLNAMLAEGKITPEQLKIGYVGAFTYAEVVSGLTSFFLGVKSQLSDENKSKLTMDVKFTGSWYTVTGERETANALIDGGCVLLSQHADSMGAPSACQNHMKGNVKDPIPNVSYNGSTVASCGDSYIVASRINWEPYFEYMINNTKAGTAFDTDWCGTLSNSSVVLTDVNDKVAAANTQSVIDTVKAELKAGTRHVFDTNTFTVNGQKLPDGYKVDGIAVVSDGYFHESDVTLYRSAPYFALQIDGINFLNQVFDPIDWEEN